MRKAIATLYKVKALGENPNADHEACLSWEDKLFILTLQVVAYDTDDAACSRISFEEYRRLMSIFHPKLLTEQPEIEVGIFKELKDEEYWIGAFCVVAFDNATKQPITDGKGTYLGDIADMHKTIHIVQTAVNDGGIIKQSLLDDMEATEEVYGVKSHMWSIFCKTGLLLPTLN